MKNSHIRCMACRLPPETQDTLHAERLSGLGLLNLAARYHLSESGLRRHLMNHIPRATAVQKVSSLDERIAALKSDLATLLAAVAELRNIVTARVDRSADAMAVLLGEEVRVGVGQELKKVEAVVLDYVNEKVGHREFAALFRDLQYGIADRLSEKVMRAALSVREAGEPAVAAKPVRQKHRALVTGGSDHNSQEGPSRSRS